MFRIFAWALVFVTAVFSILLLSLRYWLLPNVEQYRESIASAISHASGQYVTLGEISANWDGFRPHMMLGTVRVHDKEGDVTLLLQRLEGTLSWRSILHGELMFREIAIDQPDLTVRRDSTGVIHIAGFALKKELSGNEHGFSDWLLNQRRVTIKNAYVVWQDHQRHAPELELLVNLRLENRGDRHRFGIRATLPAKLAEQLDMRGDFTGETLENPGLWRGRLFMQINNADVAAWRAWLPFPQEIKLNRGFGALRMWAGIDGANMSAMTADIRLYNVDTQMAPNLPALSLTRLRGRVGWQKMIEGTDDVTRLFAHKLSATVRGKRELPPVDFSLQTVAADEVQPGSNILSIDNVKLEILWDLAKYLPISAPLQGKIKEVLPRGQLHSMQIKWNGNWPTPSSFSAKGRFTNLGMKKSGRLPGFSGVTGNMDITQEAGTVNLNCRNALLHLPDVFDESLPLNTLTGQASWIHADKNSVALKFHNISFSNAHASGSAYGNYRTTTDGPGVIDLVAHLGRADANYLLQHLPIKRFYPIQLGEAVIGGTVRDARIRLKGNLAQFPFADASAGIFRLDTKLSGITLDNLLEWPRIENLTGNLRFNGRGLEFNASQADILGAKLSRVKIHTADLAAPEAVLKGELEASGPTRQFVKFATSRTHDTLDDRLVDDIGITGDGRLRLKLDIPLNGGRPFKFSGNYQLIDNQ
ncbi:MAG TPA: DUF3971 domain-containing protein, partial [Nitrosospira sp.]|nr:DUF3971 domain-containing protein [Nitrosospira sp.]